MVCRWRHQFLEGCTDISDEPQSGRPSEITEDIVNTVRCLIEEDGWQTTLAIERYLAEETLTPISHPTILKILRDELGLSKICACWVPKHLTGEHKQNCMAAAIEFLSLHHAKGESLFVRIVTGDEKWVHHFMPEMKQASMVWKSANKPAPVKAKERERLAGKVLLTTFWDSQGVLLEEYVAPKQTIAKDKYFDTLIRLCQAIKNKRLGKLLQKIFFIHENAKPHCKNCASVARGLPMGRFSPSSPFNRPRPVGLSFVPLSQF